MKAFGSTALISILPTIILFAIPFEKGQQPIPYRLHNGLLAFAAGGLLGDVFLHTIPHLLGGEHDHHDHRNLAESESGHEEHDHHDHEHHEHHDEHEHDHKHEQHEEYNHDHSEHHSEHDHSHGKEVDPHQHGLNIGLYILLGFALFFVFEKVIRTHSHSHTKTTTKKPKGKSDTSLSAKLTSGGLLNLAADSLHNFTDGVAIGASFVGGGGLGLAVFLSILAHELPHEIGEGI